jgi:3-oxoacyl-[acyl-carrier-protein] synthase II
MEPSRDIVITGIGVVSPIGIGNEPFWTALLEGCSGVRQISLADGTDLPCSFGGEVLDFKAGQYVQPRKNIKVMSRDIQLASAAAVIACNEAKLESGSVDPDRLGVSFGADMMPCELPEMIEAYRACMTGGQFEFNRWGGEALPELYPLWMLKYLPNMPACHIAINRDARGPNNSPTLGEVSSLVAIAEATRVIERGQADAMIAGGTGSRLNPTTQARQRLYPLSQRSDNPAAACRPFDADRDGMVHGEGAGSFVLETRRHAEARGARILARVLGSAATFEPQRNDQPPQGRAIALAIRRALREAQLDPADVGHVNANGLSTIEDDAIEARAIRETLGDVPVTAPKSYFGNLSAGTGAVEMAASVLGLQHGLIPPTLNYERPDPDCPVNVIHARPQKADRPVALLLNHARTGQAIAVLIARD